MAGTSQSAPLSDDSQQPPPLSDDSQQPPPLSDDSLQSASAVSVNSSPLSSLTSHLRRYGSSLCTSSYRFLQSPVSTLLLTMMDSLLPLVLRSPRTSFTLNNGRHVFYITITRLNQDSSSSSSSDEYVYDLRQAGRLAKLFVPSSFLLLLILIHKHLSGLCVLIYITAFMFKSNDILKKQTALKRERELSVLVGHFIVSVLYVIGVFWWYPNDDIFSPLIMVPPKAISSFWHAIFTILINDFMVRQAAITFKVILLMYYRNGRGHNFRRQGQLLSIIEYALLLYRSLLPTPVWYRFFLTKDYGSTFSLLTRGMYLGFKLASVFERVWSFFSSLKALSRKEMHYGSYATLGQVNDTGESCAVCQEKMHIPVLLSCKHVFCEDCVTEWFERDRSCPLCRAVVQPADAQSYADGSTCLSIQLF